ncbi:hypothetical protein D6833_07540 [Candidatus Parcubacteria bacterium]|nr:MAG: hypothetical protein D6833_07540 [Candidatus Parcubacteria bacterium]
MSALKSLSSLLISFLSVLGIVLTLAVYFIVNPSVASLKGTSSSIFSSVVEMSDAMSYNSKAVSYVMGSQAAMLSKMKVALNNTVDGLRATRSSLDTLEVQGGYDFSNETVRLKSAEDELVQLLIEVNESERKLNESIIEPIEPSKDLSTRIMLSASEYETSLSSLSTLYTGLTVSLVLMFLIMILLSAENMLD